MIAVLRTQITILILSIITLWACDPCSDCGPVNQEPTVGLFFLNANSLGVTTDSLLVVDTLIVAVDTLSAVNDRIDDGAIGLESKKLTYEEFIDGLTDLRTVEDDFLAYLKTNKIDLNTIISTIESGSVLIEQLLLVNTGLDSVFTDSMTSYSAPLHLTSEETELAITLSGTRYELVLSYDLFDEVDIDHRVLRIAQNILVKSHSFDSVRISCDSIHFDCDTGLVLDKETIITCYF